MIDGFEQFVEPAFVKSWLGFSFKRMMRFLESSSALVNGILESNGGD